MLNENSTEMNSVDITDGQRKNKKRGIVELNSTIDNLGILTNCSHYQHFIL